MGGRTDAATDRWTDNDLFPEVGDQFCKSVTDCVFVSPPFEPHLKFANEISSDFGIENTGSGAAFQSDCKMK